MLETTATAPVTYSDSAGMRGTMRIDSKLTLKRMLAVRLGRGKPLNLPEIDRVSGHVEVVHPLQGEPELRRHSKGLTDTQGSVRGHGPATVDDLIDTPRRHTDRLRQTILADSKLLEKLRQMFSGVDGGNGVVAHNVLTHWICVPIASETGDVQDGSVVVLPQ